jgi:molybdate transport system regulatory protein
MTNKPLFSAEALGHDVIDKRMDILRRIGEGGSISEAARAAGVSYKAAWQAVDTLTNLAGTPLVERTVGGSGGGGAALTAAGQQLLRVAASINAMRQKVLEEHTRSADQTPLRIAGLSLQTSLRNQLPCTLVSIQRFGRVVRVLMHLPDTSALASRITRESAELLSLQPGMPLLALAKATAVTVLAQAEPSAPGPNRLEGKVARVARATSGDEVVLTLTSGLQLVGFSAPGLRLQIGEAATALLEESAVVLATGG